MGCRMASAKRKNPKTTSKPRRLSRPCSSQTRPRQAPRADTSILGQEKFRVVVKEDGGYEQLSSAQLNSGATDPVAVADASTSVPGLGHEATLAWLPVPKRCRALACWLELEPLRWFILVLAVACLVCVADKIMVSVVSVAALYIGSLVLNMSDLATACLRLHMIVFTELTTVASTKQASWASISSLVAMSNIPIKGSVDPFSLFSNTGELDVAT
ncbi:uncharacterized protein J3D65DRAFT_604454 [Phyllosticta citribraziliensis]|uniref:Uncharacterized protein n=1 Tax=Phyllosticta citribraziliensis TaxID=989973 RepID=A0ABR1LIJ4_9PEZI